MIHLRPTAELAERVLLPGDPGRALALAQLLLDRPRMFNHHRGLWGYTGEAADGEQLTIQSTGMGGPSAAIVLHELVQLGVRRAIRVGTCGALHQALSLGDILVVEDAIAANGASAALGAGELAQPDAGLTNRLKQALATRSPESATNNGGRGASSGRIVSTDLFYEDNSRRGEQWAAAGALAVEMEASTLFAVGGLAGIAVACVLAVSDTFDAASRRIRIEDRALLEASETMGLAAVKALRVP